MRDGLRNRLEGMKDGMMMAGVLSYIAAIYLGIPAMICYTIYRIAQLFAA